MLENETILKRTIGTFFYWFVYSTDLLNFWFKYAFISEDFDLFRVFNFFNLMVGFVYGRFLRKFIVRNLWGHLVRRLMRKTLLRLEVCLILYCYGVHKTVWVVIKLRK